MDEELPLVENIDDEEALAGYVESFDQATAGGNDHASVENEIIDLQGDENVNGLAAQASNATIIFFFSHFDFKIL